MIPRAEEPEPIDLLEVAGGAAMARYAAPGRRDRGRLVLLIVLLVRAGGATADRCESCELGAIGR